MVSHIRRIMRQVFFNCTRIYMLTEDLVSTIREDFKRLQTKEDLLNLINRVCILVSRDKKPFSFVMGQLTWYANQNLNRSRYLDFTVRKKSGGKRVIHSPTKPLKVIQRALNLILQSVSNAHSAATGFVPGRSVIDNAKVHVGQRYVFNVDLKDFFPSIEQARVWRLLQLPPFNLNKETSADPKYMPWAEFKNQVLNRDEVIFKKFRSTFVSEIIVDKSEIPPISHQFSEVFAKQVDGKYLIKLFVSVNTSKEKPLFALIKTNSFKPGTEGQPEKVVWLVNEIPAIGKQEIANLIAGLCCTEIEVERKDQDGNWVKVKRNVLPQGAPTSPTLTNIVCQKMDHRLNGVAKRFGLRYTRYVDDITFSSMHNVYNKDSEFLAEMNRIIKEQGFEIKSSKTRLQKEGYRQEVTGIIVNEKMNVSKRYVKQIRMWLYYWERYGYGRAQSFFLPQYIREKAHILKGQPDLSTVIDGKLNYLKMVTGDSNGTVGLQKRYNRLIGKENEAEVGSRQENLQRTLDLLLNEGLEKAITFYENLE